MHVLTVACLASRPSCRNLIIISNKVMSSPMPKPSINQRLMFTCKPAMYLLAAALPIGCMYVCGRHTRNPLPPDTRYMQPRWTTAARCRFMHTVCRCWHGMACTLVNMHRKDKWAGRGGGAGTVHKTDDAFQQVMVMVHSEPCHLPGFQAATTSLCKL